jgi:urea transport system substrate-binding protein
MVRDALQSGKAKLVGEEFALLSQKNFSTEIKKIQAARPDIIFNSLIGSSNIDFMAELRAAGITSKQVPTLSFTMGENELAQIADIDLSGDYLAASYFQALKRPQNEAFVQRFRNKYGDYRVTSAAMEAAYCSVYLWAQAVDAAGVVDTAAIRSNLRNQSFDGPGGIVRIDAGNQHTWRTFRLARIGPDGPAMLGGSETLIPPEPFPASRTRAEWEAFAESLRKRWGGSWVNPEKPNPLKQ